MTLQSAAAWLQSLPLPLAIHESGSLFPVIETVHVFALAIVVGSIATVDLRLLGLARRDEPAGDVAAKALPWTWKAFAIAVVSGLLLFSSAAEKYVANPAFGIKLLLLACAGANMAVFQRRAGRDMALWDPAATPAGAKIAGGLSLLFWIGVVTAGRWIGFINAGMAG